MYLAHQRFNGARVCINHVHVHVCTMYIQHMYIERKQHIRKHIPTPLHMYLYMYSCTEQCQHKQNVIMRSGSYMYIHTYILLYKRS